MKWITRSSVKVDRVACPWLIRRFVDPKAEYGAAFALALSGDIVRAQELADDMEKRFSEDTAARFSYLPVVHVREIHSP